MLDAGDAAFVIEFGQKIDHRLFEKVTNTDRHIQQLHAAGLINGLIETVPTFRSLAVIFDPLVTRQQTILDTLVAHPQQPNTLDSRPRRQWQLPVCYGGDNGPDLNEVAHLTGFGVDEVITTHHSQVYTVYMLGFLPGYAFMGDLPDTLRLPRRTQPRTRVPRGSVSIANQLTGVYPWECPGGWHLLGYCPLPFFNAAHNPPALLRADDSVRFYPVSQPELITIEHDIAANRLDPQAFCKQ